MEIRLLIGIFILIAIIGFKIFYDKPKPFIKSEPELYNRCKLLVSNLKDNDNSGEWKRHQVYAQLVKEFPLNKKSDIGYCIEEVLQHLR